MSSAGLPKELTRGYGTAFRTMLSEVAARTLTIQDLKDLDDAEMGLEIARAELHNQLKSEHDSPE